MSLSLVLERLLFYGSDVPRPRVHDLDRVLDVAEQLAADGGPERLTVRQLASAAGVSNGVIYHAFGSLAVLQARMWLRAATELFALQSELIDDALGGGALEGDAAGQAAGVDTETAVAAVVAAADAPACFAARRPAAAKMLLTVGRNRLLGPELPGELADTLIGLDRRLVSSVLCRLASALWGRRDGPSVEVITTCVVDLPTALLGRVCNVPAQQSPAPISADVRARLAAAVRGVLAPGPPPRRGDRDTTQ